MDSEDVARCLSTQANKAAFLGGFAPGATLRDRAYSLTVQFVPLTLNLDSESEVQNIEAVNKLPSGSILQARWIKPVH